MSLCSKCNFRIDNDDFCLKYTRYIPIEAEIIRTVLSSGKCSEYMPELKANSVIED